MNIWIDIEIAEQVPFIKALSEELKSRGHTVIITTLDSKEIKKKISEHCIEATVLGKKVTFFGLFSEQADILRFTSLADHIQGFKFPIAFSLGSKPMLVTCTNLNIPIVLFLENHKDKIGWIHYALEKSYFIVQDTVTEQQILKQDINPKKIAKINQAIELKGASFSTRSIKEIASKIELFSSFRDIKA